MTQAQTANKWARKMTIKMLTARYEEALKAGDQAELTKIAKALLELQ